MQARLWCGNANSTALHCVPEEQFVVQVMTMFDELNVNLHLKDLVRVQPGTGHCKEGKPGEDVKFSNSVNKILTWKTHTRVTPSDLENNYARPPSKGCETTADQPMLYALIYKILTIIRNDSVSPSSEQYVASIVPSEKR